MLIDNFNIEPEGILYKKGSWMTEEGKLIQIWIDN